MSHPLASHPIPNSSHFPTGYICYITIQKSHSDCPSFNTGVATALSILHFVLLFQISLPLFGLLPRLVPLDSQLHLLILSHLIQRHALIGASRDGTRILSRIEHLCQSRPVIGMATHPILNGIVEEHPRNWAFQCVGIVRPVLNNFQVIVVIPSPGIARFLLCNLLPHRLAYFRGHCVIFWSDEGWVVLLLITNPLHGFIDRTLVVGCVRGGIIIAV
mmetsp:Transcript_35866/g.46438  ORF Transcript_35866/g.46438 Transcript_35866/m.46438 type:complete len:217 (-) Transcript_35866:65-715(-)